MSRWARHTQEFASPKEAFDSLRPIGNIGIFYHSYTLWLFTLSDWKALIGPETLLALASATSGRFVAGDSLIDNSQQRTFRDAAARMPTVVAWLWLTTLLQDVANQRLQSSVKEDHINKPWRPLPSKRISAEGADKLLFCIVPAALAFSGYLGPMVLKACAVLICFVWMYNDLNGSSSNPLVRNALNACGFVTYGVGATAIATEAMSFSDEAIMWFIIVWLAIFTTSQGQDFADMEGDRARGRASMPLAFGENLSRWLLAIAVSLWSFTALHFWNREWFSLRSPALVAVVLLITSGVITSVVAIFTRSEDANKWLLKLWCLWVAALFISPIVSVGY